MEKNIYKDGTYLKSNPTWHAEDSPWKARNIINLLNRNKLKPSTICEIGCGSGEILRHLSMALGDKVMLHGYEISPQAFEICRTKETQNLKFYLKDLLETKKTMFDVVMVIDILEHVENYFDFLRKIRTKGKYKIFHIPLDLSVQTVLRSSPILKSRASIGHIHYFTKETALATLKDTGYRVIDYFYTKDFLKLPNLGWKTNLLKLPRELLFSINQDLAVRIFGRFSLLVLAR